jgi:hypothetical protein
MNNQEIKFDDFIDEFFSNMNKQKMVLHIDIENKTNKTNKTNTTTYDIHCMLLDLFIAGIYKFKLKFLTESDLYTSLDNLQYFFNNINIKLNIINFSKKELIKDNSPYENRFIKFTIKNPNELIINAQHNKADELEEINSFFLIDDNTNLCISFEHEIIE